MRWLRACVTDNAWQAYRVTLQHNCRVSLFSKFGTSAESASVAQKTMVEAVEQQPDAQKAASDLINDSTATSVPEVRRRVNNLMTISSAGQDDTLRSILGGFGPDISSRELRDSKKFVIQLRDVKLRKSMPSSIELGRQSVLSAPHCRCLTWFLYCRTSWCCTGRGPVGRGPQLPAGQRFG